MCEYKDERPIRKNSVNLMVWFPVIAIVLFFMFPLKAQGYGWGTGLEVADYRDVPLVIERLPGEAEQIGLQAERIRTKTELRLRTAGLRPTVHEGDHYLYIQVNVVSRAFQITLEFKRPVSYKTADSRTYSKLGIVWNTTVTGTHENDPEYIITTIDTLLDRFINEYLASNDID